MSLDLRFLGVPTIEIDGEAAPLQQRRAVLLLCLLALRGGRPVSRQMLTELIWPERDPESAAVNLRRALSDLRALLGKMADCIESPDRRDLLFRISASTVRCDVFDFDIAARRFEGGDIAAAAKGAQLYGGPLLDGWVDECLLAERRYRQEIVVTMREALAREAIHERQDAAEALRLCAAAEQVDPYRETTLRLRIEAHLAQGDRAAAEAAFRAFSERLSRELGSAPARETQRVIEELVARNSRTEVVVAPASPRMAPLPLERTPLFGRDQEIRGLLGQLTAERTSYPTLLTITGPGGVGKTRLAVAAARAWAATKAEGSADTVFVDLALLPVSASLDTICTHIAEALGASDLADPWKAVRLRLGQQKSRLLLLLLDNAEHLLPTLALMTAALLRDAGESCRLLATSRTPLNLPGERLLDLQPLAIPSGKSTDEVLASDAARLFLAVARAAQPDLEVTAATAPQIAHLCQRLDGLPLALELVASRLSALPLAELEAQIAGTQPLPLPLLSGGSVVGPERQRTIADMIAWSWSLLSVEQQTLLARLSVFPGSWTREAAEAVAGFSPLAPGAPLVTVLAQLVNHSLVQRVVEEPPVASTVGRYRLLETVRAFAAERLAESNDVAVHERHAGWAAEFAEQIYSGLWGSDAVLWASRATLEEDNLHAGLEVADAARARQIVHGIEPLWWRQARFREGLAWYAIARRKAVEERDYYLVAVARLNEEQYRNNLGEPHRARMAFTEMIALERKRGENEIAAYLLHSLGFLLRAEGSLTAATTAMEEGLALAEQIAQKTGETGLCAYQWRGLAAIEVARRNFDTAELLCSRAVGEFQVLGIPAQELTTLPWLGRALLGKRDYPAAAAILTSAHSLAEQNGSVPIVQEVVQLLGEVALATGVYAEAEEHFRQAESQAREIGSREGIALAACGESALARAIGRPSLLPCLRVLYDSAVIRLPYPSLATLLSEATAAAEACQFYDTARKLAAESAVCEAVRTASDSDWSPGLVVMRARAAFSPDRVQAALHTHNV